MADEVDDMKIAQLLLLFQEFDSVFQPFEDGAGFESFSLVQYEDKRSRKVPRIKELTSPLKVYKFLLLKLAIPLKLLGYWYNDKDLCEWMMIKLAEYKVKYASFLRKGIHMTAEEKKYVKSAFASFQLAEIVVTAQGQELKVEKYDFLKLKEICSEILGCYNAGGEETVQYLFFLCGKFALKRYFQTSYFLLCLMAEILKKTKEVGTRLGFPSRDEKLTGVLKSIESSVESIKLKCLACIFDNSSILQLTGPIKNERYLKDDAVKAKMLMELFKNHESDDEFCKVPLKIESYDQAKAVHGLILRLADKLEPKDEDDVWDADHYKGLAYGNLAAFATDPAEVYRLSEISCDLLDGARNLNCKKSNFTYVLETIDINLQRMWKIKCEIYNRDKSAENLKQLKEVASKRILFGKFHLFVKSAGFTYYRWWIRLDLVECISKVYGHYSCARKFAEEIYEDLKASPSEKQKFNKVAGIRLDKMGKQKFAEVFPKTFNSKMVKVKNPFSDGSKFETFVALYYDDLSEDILAEADLTTPINIYKFILLTFNQKLDKNEEFSGSHALMLNKIKDVKAKYKKFLSLEISMTPEDQKHVRSAYAVVRLAEMSLNVNKKGTKTEDFDFQKFKGICIALMEGFSGETSIDYLKHIYYYMEAEQFFEVCRFISCVMTEILEQSQAVRSKNDTILQYCPCVAEELTELQKRNYWRNWELLDETMAISSVLFNHSIMSWYKNPASDKINGKMLMQIFEGYEGDNADFHKVPLIAENFDQAKQIYDLILKLTKEREEIGEMRHYDDSIYFQGLSLSKFAEFHSNPDEKYRLLETSTDFLVEILEKHPDGLRGLDPDILRRCLEAVNENLRRMWTIKLEINNSDNNEENRKALTAVAQKRIKWGLLYVEHHSDSFEFNPWWTFLDMMKCQLQVFRDQAAAKKCAASIWNELINVPIEILIFTKITGFNFKTYTDKPTFVKAIMDKYK